MARKGISAAIGTLLFAVIASAFLALALRMYYDTAALAREVSRVVFEREQEGVPRVELNFTALRAASTAVYPLIHSGYVAGATYRVRCLDVSDPGAKQLLRGVSFPVPATGCVALVRLSAEKGTLGSVGNLTVAVSGDPAFVEVYEGGGGAWKLVSAYLLNRSAARVGYRNWSLVYAHNPNSSSSFELSLSGFESRSASVSSVTEVIVRNEGPALLDVRAVWLLNSTVALRLEERRVLAVGEAYVFRFQTPVTLNSDYEVRVVTRVRTYAYRFRVGG